MGGDKKDALQDLTKGTMILKPGYLNRASFFHVLMEIKKQNVQIVL